MSVNNPFLPININAKIKLLKNQSESENSLEANYSKILHGISVADSYLNEVTKENSVTNAISLLTDILNSKIKFNQKNIILIIFTKTFECFLKANNQTKCKLNFFFKKFQILFTQISIPKDYSQKLSFEIYNSFSLTRLFHLQFIKILPNVLLNRLDLINSVKKLINF